MTPGGLFQLVRSGRAVTRAALGQLSGLSRTAVTARVEALTAAGLLAPGEVVTTGGRPSESLRVVREAGVVLALAIGRSRHQVGLYDLEGNELASSSAEHEVGTDAPTLMPIVAAAASSLLGRDLPPLLAIGMSLPGSVEADRIVGSPVMPGWDGVPLRPYLSGLGLVPLFVGNDADVLAHAELLGRPDLRDALVLKASTGLGLGVVVESRIVSGSLGASGQLGHCRVPDASGLVCRCGSSGCLEAIAGGWALIAEHPSASHVRELAALARSGDVAARVAIHQAGLRIGQVLAVAVNLLNPEAIIVGGDMAEAFDPLTTGLKESVYAGAGSLATSELRFLPSLHGPRAGLVGCAALALDRALSPSAIDARLAG